MLFETIDLDTQDIRDASGRRVTQDTVDGLLRAARKVGRPSLTAPGAHSPTITLRLSEAVNTELIQIASRQGKPKSQIVRDAVDQYLAHAA